MKTPRFPSIRPFDLGVAVVLVGVLAVAPSFSGQYFTVLLSTIFMYVVLTVSWTIFSGPTGYISLAPAAFFGMGVYAAALFSMNMSLPAIVAVGAFASFAVALAVGALTLKLKGIYFAIFTFVLVKLIGSFLMWWEVNISHTVGRIVIGAGNRTVYFWMLGIVVLAVVAAYYFRHSRYGLALQSIGDHEDAAAHSGINVTRVKVLVFAVSAVFMGAAGAVMATRWTYIDPRIAFNPSYSFLPVLMAIFGGMGRIYGPVLGAAIFAYLEQYLITRFPYHYMLIFGIILVIAILYMPEGLAGLLEKGKRRVMGRRRAGA